MHICDSYFLSRAAFIMGLAECAIENLYRYARRHANPADLASRRCAVGRISLTMTALHAIGIIGDRTGTLPLGEGKP